MKIQFKYIIGFLASSIVAIGTVFGQNVQVHVATRTVEKHISTSLKQRLIIEGEKSKIYVEGWDKNYIGLTIKLISKNKDKLIAGQDIEAIKYEVKDNQDEISISNYYLKTGIESVLQVNYQVNVPKNIELEVRNLYGEVEINNINGVLMMNINFGKAELSNIAGNVNLTSNYADIIANNIDADVHFKTEKADIILRRVSGKYNLECSYGTVDLQAIKQLKALKILAKNTAVKMYVDAFDNYNYHLTTSYDKIEIPGGYLERNNKGKYIKTFRHGAPEIIIQTTFSPITIQSTKLTSAK